MCGRDHGEGEKVRMKRAERDAGYSTASPPPPDLPVYGGGRGLRGPRRMLRPGRHVNEGGLGTRGSSPLSHTTSYAFCTPSHGGG